MKAIIIIALVGLINGCTGPSLFFNNYVDEANYDFKTRPIEDVIFKSNASYAARYMMGNNARIAFEKSIHGEFDQKSSQVPGTISNLSTATNVVIDVATHELNSNLGKDVSATVFVAGSIYSFATDVAALNGKSRVAQAFLPLSYNGVKISTPEKASDVLHSEIMKRLKAFSSKYSLNLLCLDGCDTLNRIYELKHTPASFDGFHYSPYTDPNLTDKDSRDLYVSISMAPFVRALNDPVRDEAMGYPVAWETPAGYSMVIGLYAGARLNENGNHRISLKKSGEFAMPVVRSMIRTHMGRMFFNQMFDESFPAFYFDGWESNNIGFYKGKVVSWDKVKPESFVSSFVIVSPPSFTK